MKKRLFAILALLMAMSLLLTACGSSGEKKSDAPAAGAADTAEDKTEEKTEEEDKAEGEENAEPTANIAIVFSTLGDLNFNDWCWDGICRARDELGIAFNYVEAGTVSEAATQIDAFASDEAYDLIVVVGSDRGDAMEESAAAYPDQKFALIDAGVKSDLPNIIGLRADYPQWQFLSGCLAGLATLRPDDFALANDKNVVGFVGGADTYASRSGAVGFLAGAKYVNPDVELLYSIVGSYTDPNTAKEIALTMYGSGADVLSVNCGSSANGVLAAAEESGGYFCSTSPALVSETNQLCISITRFDNFVYTAVEMVLNDTWEPGTHIYGISDGACEISFDGVNIEVPDDIMDILKDIQQKISDGEIKFPEDPNDIDEWAKTYKYEG